MKATRTKGQFGHECNRRECTTVPAHNFNRSTGLYYCDPCAGQINRANRFAALSLYGSPALCVAIDPSLSERFRKIAETQYQQTLARR